MGVPDLEWKRAERQLRQFCDEQVPPERRHQYRLEFGRRGKAGTLYEWRPPFPGTLATDWVRIVVAQFRYEPRTRWWTLYCADRNSRWHRYNDIPPAADLTPLLGEVREDPTGIFWG